MPVATAGWGDLVGLLVFLIISGWINYSRRKKAEEEAQGLPGPRPGPQAPESGASPRRPATRSAADDEDEGWNAESWEGEHSERWDDHDVRETRSSEARDPEARSGEARSAEARLERLTGGRKRPDASGGATPARAPEAQRNIPGDRDEAPKPKAPAAADRAREKASEMGRDILTQLAKELGLELPKPGRQPPKPPAATPAPAPGGRIPSRTASQPLPSSRPVSAGPDAARARAAEEARARSLQATRGSAASAQRNIVAAAPAPALSPLSADLAHPEALRKAFILKTILDRPVSMRPPAGPSPAA